MPGTGVSGAHGFVEQAGGGWRQGVHCLCNMVTCGGRGGHFYVSERGRGKWGGGFREKNQCILCIGVWGRGE